jgi:hypothetical protein
MLARVAACAAWLFAWSVSAEIHGRALPFPRVAVAAAQEMAQEQVITAADQNLDAKRKTQAAPRQDASTAAPSAGAEPASANQAVSFQIALTPEAAPFGARDRTRLRRRNSAQMDGRRIGNSRRQTNFGALPQRPILVSLGGTTFPCHCR